MTEQLGRPVQQPRPSDYQLMLPDGWFRIPLEPERREGSVDALVSRRFKGIDDAPHMRELLRKELLEQAADAYEGGGIELYLSFQQAGSLTIPASLLISLVPPGNAGATMNPQDIEASLSGAGRSVSVVELPAGTTVRRRLDPGTLRDSARTGEDDYALPSVTVDYQIPVPGTEQHLLLTFSTPLVQIAEAMVELFDAVAGSLRWIEGDVHEG